MKKILLFTMFLAVILVFTDCQSTSKTTNDSRDTTPSVALEEVTVASSKKDSRSRSPMSNRSAAKGRAAEGPTKSHAIKESVVSNRPATTTTSTITSGHISDAIHDAKRSPKSPPPPPPRKTCSQARTSPKSPPTHCRRGQ